jgi:two-component system sensor kinase FixL
MANSPPFNPPNPPSGPNPRRKPSAGWHEPSVSEHQSVNRQWRKAASVAGIGAWDWEIGTQRVQWCSGVAPLLGMKEDEFDNTLETALRLIHPDDRPYVRERIEHAAEHADSYEVEFRVTGASGETRWLAGRGRAICDETGQPRRVIGAVIDVTEHKQSEAVFRTQAEQLEQRVAERTKELEVYASRLAESQQQYEALNEALPFGTWICEPDGRLRFVSQPFLDLVGMSLEEARTSGWEHLVPASERSSLRQAWDHCVATGESWDRQYRLLPPNGPGRTILSRGQPVHDATGQIISWVGINLDVTEREQAKRLMAEREAELAHLGRLGLMGELASGLAHELNQPLAAISSYAQGCLQRLDGPAAQPESLRYGLEHVVQQAERAGRIIRQLREFARVGEPAWSIVAVNHLVAEVVELVGGELQRNRIELNQQLAEDLPPVRVGRIEIEQVLLNLVRNAMEAMNGLETGPRQLTIASSMPDPDHVRLTVRDTGPGVSDEALAHMFDPFYTTKETGMGVGLNLCETLVQHHQGELWAERHAYGGLAMQLQLPVHTRNDDQSQLPAE